MRGQTLSLSHFFSEMKFNKEQNSSQNRHQQTVQTMTAPKLSPTERLFRKRTAARLRQQRCRERKRMDNSTKHKIFSKEPSKPSLKSSLPPRKLWKARILASFQPRNECWSDSSSLRSDVGRSSSFDTVSTTASCDSQHYEYSSSPNSSPSMGSKMPPLPIHFDYRFPTLPNKEETAIDAMLALKSKPPPCPPTRLSPFAVWDHYGTLAHHFPFHPRPMQGGYHAVPYAV